MDYKHNAIYINKKLIYLNTLPKNIITIEDFINDDKSATNYFTNYFITHNNKIINKNTTLYDIINTHTHTHTQIHTIDIIERQNGGGLVGMFMNIMKISQLFAKIGDFLKWLALFTIWFIEFVLWVILDFLNPKKLANDFYNSIIILVIAICKVPFDILYKLFEISANAISGWMQGFWGWDQSSLTKNDKNSNYFKSFDRTKGSKCYLSNSNTVPFSIILGTILCPPMGVFMDMGLTGWVNILICCLLTLAYYIPGLVYALLIIYS